MSNDVIFEILSKFRNRTIAGVILPSNDEKLDIFHICFTDGTSITITPAGDELKIGVKDFINN